MFFKSSKATAATPLMPNKTRYVCFAPGTYAVEASLVESMLGVSSLDDNVLLQAVEYITPQQYVELLKAAKLLNDRYDVHVKPTTYIAYL